MSGIEILLSDNRGVYIPQHFAEMVRSGASWKGFSEEDLKTIEKGPDAEWYWESWEAILSNASIADSRGHVWYLHQDGDLFACCDELMTDEEYEGFFGESRP